MPRNVTCLLACCHGTSCHVPSYFMFNTRKLALANWWHCLAALRSFVIPLEWETKTLYKLEVTGSREFLTKEYNSVVGGMA